MTQKPGHLLEVAILQYVALTTEQPEPFLWTKTAGEILASVPDFTRQFLTRHSVH